MWCCTIPICLALLWASPTQPAATDDDTPREVCRLKDSQIREGSGIAASRLHPGHYYIHNDSGDGARVFLVDRTGATRLEIRLRGVQAVDCEDIAMAPGPAVGGWDVCLADIGDNDARRASVTIYRFAEPALPADGATRLEIEAAAVPLRYADGPANAEGFCVHPQTGDGYILTKALDGRCAVYKLAAPWSVGQETVLPRLRAVEMPPEIVVARLITAADIHPDGRRLAVRCYVDGWEWVLPAQTPVAEFDRIFDAPPQRLLLPAERTAEGLCYDAAGAFILTIGEGKKVLLHETPAP